MAKGFAIAITTVFILTIMIVYMQNFVAKQNSELNKVSQLMAAEKVTHSWSDISDDINRAINLLIEKYDDTVIFRDKLPADKSINTFLSNYGLFIKTFYKTPDLDVKFLSPDGKPMDLGDLPPVITIKPQNIQYFYSPKGDSWAKNELFINSSVENFTAIKEVKLNITLINAIFNCLPYGGSKPCEGPGTKSPPSAWCDKDPTKAKYPLFINISVFDANGNNYNFSQNCAELDKPGAVWNPPVIDPKDPSSDYWVKFNFGVLPNTVINVQFHNIQMDTKTALILNTSDFYISYLAQIETTAVGYDTDRIDYAYGAGRA